MKATRLSAWNVVWLVAAVLYFFVPLYATAEFSLETGPGQYGFDHYRSILEDPQFRDSFWYSFKLAVETIIFSTILMVPTVYWVNLRLPRLRRVIDFIAVLPFVVPPIALGLGLARLFHNVSFLIESPQLLVFGYVILVLPFSYRSIDAGMRSIDLHTLSEAAQSMGARWPTVLWRVILPNVRSAMLSSAFLTVTLVMGEFTMASLLLFPTFAVYVQYIGVTKANPAAALAVISFALTWLTMAGFLLIGRRAGPKRATQIGGVR